MKEISILGCGWLGFRLAQSLIKRGYSVNGSTTSPGKLDAMEQAGIKPFLISLSENAIEGDISGFLSTDMLIVDIPPRIAAGNFVAKIKTLIPFIEKARVEKVLFVSSVSVYGESGEAVDETTRPNPDTENGRQILQAENLLQSKFSTTVLRFGGLVGADRHPVRHLSGKTAIANPDAPINLIHQTDCIGIIEMLISKNIWGGVYNGVDPFHPSREEYYSHKAREMGLPLPEFDHFQPSIGKTVSAQKLIDLGYRFSGLV